MKGCLTMSKRVIGILGGMGPAATVELFSRIVKNTSAKTDQDHINTVIINDPQIPDRTEFIFGNGENPVPRMVNNLNKLYKAGADTAIIPCMTAHSFISEMQKSSPIPIVNAIELVEKHLQNFYPDIQKVGLLATNGSVNSGVFRQYISKEIITPTNIEQEKLMNVIYGDNGIKSGNTGSEVLLDLNNIVSKVKEKKIQAVIAGCTELSLVMSEESFNLPVIDPILLLAKEAVRLGNSTLVKTI